MQHKSPPQQQGSRAAIELDEDLEAPSFPEIAHRTRSLPPLDHYPPRLQKMLESSKYQLELVSRSECTHIHASHTDPFPAALPAVLFGFGWKELIAQVCELARGSNPPPERKVARFGDCCVDFNNMEVTRSSGETVALTNQEFKALKCFLLNPNRVFSRDELLKEAWGYENYPCTRTVDNHVSQLRQKLERDPANPVHFRTVYRVGYKFVP
jgi:hypothetical protein